MSDKIKLYIVQTMDGDHNYSMTGIYTDLKKAEADIRKQYPDHPDIDELRVYEYKGVYGPVFDNELYNHVTGDYIRIFGYIVEVDLNDPVYIKITDKLTLEAAVKESRERGISIGLGNGIGVGL